LFAPARRNLQPAAITVAAARRQLWNSGVATRRAPAFSGKILPNVIEPDPART
jgi:hypothetical protein